MGSVTKACSRQPRSHALFCAAVLYNAIQLGESVVLECRVAMGSAALLQKAFAEQEDEAVSQVSAACTWNTGSSLQPCTALTCSVYPDQLSIVTANAL